MLMASSPGAVAMNEDHLRNIMLEIMEKSLEAQLSAIRQLRGRLPAAGRQPRPATSQIDLAYDVLRKAGGPLHITDLISRIQVIHGINVNRDSLSAALNRRVARSDRFTRTSRNTFGLLE